MATSVDTPVQNAFSHRPADFLNCGASAAKAYELACLPVCKRYRLTQTALNILLFIANNPGCNTARDICLIRGIKTGIASIAIESLIQAGYLQRQRDALDRRIQRLALTSEAEAPVAEGQAVQKKFLADIFDGVSEEQFSAFLETVEKVSRNICQLAPGDYGKED